MAYQREICIEVHAAHGEEVAALLVELGAQGAWIEDDQTRAVPGREVVTTCRATVRACFAPAAGLEARVVSAVGEHLAGARPEAGLEIRWQDAEDRDWNATWKAQWQVQQIGQRLRVVPSWLSHEALPEEVVLVMDPGMAFGTGTHETTRLCAEALEQLVQPGHSVLDVGCGTGILALFAAGLGARPVVAVDNDAEALQVARETAQRNGLAADIQLIHSAEVHVPGCYDVVVANILMQPLLDLCQAITARVRPAGWLLLSGLLVNQLDAVSSRYLSCGAVERSREQRGEWGLLRLQHSGRQGD
ncbi:MAG: 50S ribosomal protein L11 methyltransferase [Pseudomonadota bacterium]